MDAKALIKSGRKSYGAVVGDGAEQGSNPHRINSWLLTGGIIVANTCGISSLPAPGAVAEFGGWLPGSLAIIALVGMNMHISFIIWRLFMCFQDKCISLSSVIGEAFSKAPSSQQNFMVKATIVSQYGYCFSCLAFNLLSLGRGLLYIFPSWHACLPVVMFVAFLASLPFQMTMRQVGSWTSLIWANFLCGSLVVIIPFIYWVGQGIEESRLPGSGFQALGNTSIESILQATSSITFMLSSQYLLVEILGEMHDAKKFPQAYTLVVAPFQLLVLCVSGLGVYYYLGGAVSGSLLNYLPFGSTLVASSVCVVVGGILMNLINAVVIGQALHRQLDPDAADSGSMRDWSFWCTLVSALLFSAWLFANIVPFFSDLVELLGTTLAPASCYIIPLLAYARCYWDFQDADEKLARISIFEWVVIAVELLFFFGIDIRRDFRRGAQDYQELGILWLPL